MLKSNEILNKKSALIFPKIEMIFLLTFQRLEKCCFWFTLKDGRGLVNGNIVEQNNRLDTNNQF